MVKNDYLRLPMKVVKHAFSDKRQYLMQVFMWFVHKHLWIYTEPTISVSYFRYTW